MTGIVASPPTLTPADRCDRCGVAASVHVILASGGELMFCGHHSREHLSRLEQLSAQIHDASKHEARV